MQYHTDEQSGASGSRDFISDGANYRADDEEINPLPMTAEESEFIQVTARSKRRGAAALVQHQLTTVSGLDRKNVYFNRYSDNMKFVCSPRFDPLEMEKKVAVI